MTQKRFEELRELTALSCDGNDPSDSGEEKNDEPEPVSGC